jgi:hypothetical protein
METSTLPTDDRVQITEFERLEDYLRAYLEDERFRSEYPAAYARWSQAAAILYGGDASEGMFAAAAKAREALAAFASVLAGGYRPLASSPGSDASTRARLAAWIKSHRQALGDARCELLEALLEYWRALNDRPRRHAHDAHDVGDELRWEDARRAVVLTALVMVEIDRSL